MRSAFCLVLFTISAVTLLAQTPRDVALEVAFAQEYSTVEKHVSRTVLVQMSNADVDVREQWLGLLLMLSRTVTQAGGRLERGDGPILVRVYTREGARVDVELSDEVIDGDYARVSTKTKVFVGEHQLQVSPYPAAVDVHFTREDGAWRIARITTTTDLPLTDLSAIRNLVRARMARNESAAVGAIRYLNTAQVTYSEQHEKYACSLTDLGPAFLAASEEWRRDRETDVSALINGAMFEGYRFSLSGCGTGRAYVIVASPISVGKSGTRSFCSDQTGIIYFAKDGDPDTCVSEKQPIR